MSVAPAGFVVLLLWVILCLRDPAHSVRMTVWMLPFGMFAVVSLPSVGGLSLLAASVLAALSVALAILRYLFAPRGFAEPVALPRPVLWYALFTLWGLVGAVLLVRIFAGDFMVVPLSRDASGTRIDLRFPTTVAPLAPGSSNISQSFYLVLGACFLMTFIAWCRRQGLVAAERALRAAALISAVLGLLDFLALDPLLEPLRTAAYALANEQGILTFQRVIGGFPEPSAFGTASATFFAYFATAWVFDRRWANAIPALANAAFVLLAFAATGYVAAALAGALLLWRGRRLLWRAQDRGILLAGLGAGAGGLALLCALLLVTPLGEMAGALIQSLFLEKGQSVSGLERGAWARYGLSAFVETWGLGAGVGSIRSNGLVPVLLGSVGWPGTLFFLLFVVSALSGPPARPGPAERIFHAARTASIAQLGAAFVSGTVPDLGLIFLTVIGLAAAAGAEGRFGSFQAKLETVQQRSRKL